MANRLKATTTTGSDVSFPSGLTQTFQAEPFMKKYRKRFLACLKPFSIAVSLKVNDLVSEDLYIEIKKRRIAEGEAKAELFLHLCSHADPEMIHNLCAILTDQTTYPLMKKLGEDMKKDSDLPPSSDLSPSSDFPPSSILTPSSGLPPSSDQPPSGDLPPLWTSDLPPSSCPPQSRTVVTSTTAEPTPSLSTSDDERTRKLKEAYEVLKLLYSRNDKTSVKSRYARNIRFINLAAVERNYYRAKPKKDAREFLEAAIHGIDGYCAHSKMIKYEKILTCSGQKSGKRLVITGAPGCGKSTLSRQLCKDIYSQALPNAYQLAILVELRRLRLQSLDPAKEDIDLPFLLQHLNRPELCPVIEEQDGTGVILILDGFDEVADWLGKSPFLSRLLSCEDLYLSKCDVFITTRPSRYRDLTTMLETPPFYIEILGFTSDSIDCFIESYFDSDLGKAEEVIHRLKTLPLVRGMCRIPRILEIVCMVQECLDDDLLSENLSGIFQKYICHQLEEYLSETHPSVKKRIQNLLAVSEDLFPGFYQLCEVAYKCCLNQRLILTSEDLSNLKDYVDTRGSIYHLLFSEDVDDRSPIAGVLHQFDHKTVQEALGAVHIGHQSKEEQKLIWMERFGVPEMAEIWRMYCGLTKLEHIDLISLSASLSPPSIDKLDWAFIDYETMRSVYGGSFAVAFPISMNGREQSTQYLIPDGASKLVMMSLYEAKDKSLSNQVLQAVFISTIHAVIRSPYDSHVAAYALSHHPSLQNVRLKFRDYSNLTESDLKPLNESIRNLKAIELDRPPVETVLSALSGQVEELRLSVQSEIQGFRRSFGEDEDYWRTNDALEDNHCLRSLHIHVHGTFSLPHEWSEMIENLCRNERLTELTMDANCADFSSVGIDVNSLKNLLVPREKCSVGLALTRQQWCAVLSGLKDVKTLKELRVDMRDHYLVINPIAVTDCDQPDECLISSAEVEELMATNEQLVKVDVSCVVRRLEELGDLVVAMVKGICRNKSITECGIALSGVHDVSEGYLPSTRSVLFPMVEALAHTDHITCVRFEYFLLPISTVLDDKWCDLLVAGPMSRPECHLRLDLTPAECGLLLSRVHNAEQLEGLSLVIWKKSDGKSQDEQEVNVQEVDVQAVEGALSKCRLRKLRIIIGFNYTPYVNIPAFHEVTLFKWYTLFGPVLRGLAANCNDVDFALLAWNLNEDYIKSQLPQQCWERFKVGKRRNWTYIKLKPHTPTGSVQRSLTSEESTSEVEASSDQVSTASKKMSPPLSLSREDQPHPISQLSSPVLTSAPKSPEHTESISSFSLSTGRDPTSQPLQAKKKRPPPSPPSRVLRPRVTAQLPSTSLSPPSSSRAKRKRISSLTKKYPTKSGTKVPPSTPQQASQESSSEEDAITDPSDLLPYMEDLLPHLTFLGTVLGVGKYTSAVMGGAGSPQEKCIKILSHWLETTPNPTWRGFCQKLKKAKEFNNLRSSIERKHLQT